MVATDVGDHPSPVREFVLGRVPVAYVLEPLETGIFDNARVLGLNGCCEHGGNVHRSVILLWAAPGMMPSNPIQLCPVSSKYFAVFRAHADSKVLVELPVIAWALAQTSSNANAMCGAVVTEGGIALAETLDGFLGYRPEDQAIIAFVTARGIHPDAVQNGSPNTAGLGQPEVARYGSHWG